MRTRTNQYSDQQQQTYQNFSEKYKCTANKSIFLGKNNKYDKKVDTVAFLTFGAFTRKIKSCSNSIKYFKQIFTKLFV